MRTIDPSSAFRSLLTKTKRNRSSTRTAETIVTCFTAFDYIYISSDTKIRSQFELSRSSERATSTVHNPSIMMAEQPSTFITNFTNNLWLKISNKKRRSNYASPQLFYLIIKSKHTCKLPTIFIFLCVFIYKKSSSSLFLWNIEKKMGLKRAHKTFKHQI